MTYILIAGWPFGCILTGVLASLLAHNMENWWASCLSGCFHGRLVCHLAICWIDWLAICLVGWKNSLLIGWLCCLVDCKAFWTVGYLRDFLLSQMACWMASLLAGLLYGWLACWLVGCYTTWWIANFLAIQIVLPTGWLVIWLPAWLAACLKC